MGSLKDDIIRLGPWHLDVEVTPEISTRAYLDAPAGTYSDELTADRVSFLDPRDGWIRMMSQIYPNGLEGRSFLECACNCGGYCFWAKEMGAGRCFGFDVREHWIEQARWLAENRAMPSDGIEFGLMDVYDLPGDLDRSDVVMFQGLLYHLPDPITALKRAADLCGELLLLDTAIRTDLPDGMLALANESTEQVMSGVYGINWFPTGPEVLQRIVRWLGFEESRVVYWRTKHHRRGRENFGRVRILAARHEGVISHLPSATEPSEVDDRPTFARQMPEQTGT